MTYLAFKTAIDEGFQDVCIWIRCGVDGIILQFLCLERRGMLGALFVSIFLNILIGNMKHRVVTNTQPVVLDVLSKLVPTRIVAACTIRDNLKNIDF